MGWNLDETSFTARMASTLPRRRLPCGSSRVSWLSTSQPFKAGSTRQSCETRLCGCRIVGEYCERVCKSWVVSCLHGHGIPIFGYRDLNRHAVAGLQLHILLTELSLLIMILQRAVGSGRCFYYSAVRSSMSGFHLWLKLLKVNLSASRSSGLSSGVCRQEVIQCFQA